MTNQLRFNIFSMGVEIDCSLPSVCKKLESDFAYFKVSEFSNIKKKLIIKVEKKALGLIIPRNLTSTKQTQNSIYYDVGDIRYNDYYGKAISVFNFSDEKAMIFYQDESFLHELIYLMILSRTGKFMDQNRFHKIHACGIHYKEINLLVMMPSKGGKTTLFCELIADSKIDIISDDTPVVDHFGKIYPFPLRVGSESREYLKEKFPYLLEEDFTLFERKNFVAKTLVSSKSLKNKVKVGKKTVLILGVRSSYDEPVLKKISKLRMLKSTLEHMVVGIGLPMIVEYFLKNTLKDHCLNMMIFLSRFRAAVVLVWQADNYLLLCSTDINRNRQKLREIFDEG